MFSGRKLPLTLAFVVLVALAFGASCKGFFVDPVLTSIAIGPTNQSVQEGDTLQMSARGTYDDGSTKNITSTATWSSDDLAVATISKGGLVTAVASGVAKISASLDAITSNSTDVNVVLTGVTAITIKPGPQSVKRGNSVTFTCEATVSGKPPQDVTATVNWTSDDTTNITISNATSPATVQVGTGAALGDHTITARYVVGSTTFTDTETLTVTN